MTHRNESRSKKRPQTTNRISTQFPNPVSRLHDLAVERKKQNTTGFFASSTDHPIPDSISI